MDQIIHTLIKQLSTIPSETLLLVEIGFYVASVLFLFNFFGLIGMSIASSLFLISANLQILKISYFTKVSHSFALGTVAFSATYLVSDIVTEHYGKRKAINLAIASSCSQIIFTTLMIITLGYNNSVDQKNLQDCMCDVFTPQVRIVFASIISYAITQTIDITCFSWLSKITKKRFIWLRINFSNFVSQVCDSFLFQLFCWRILSNEYKELHDVIFVYTAFGFVPRFLVGIITTPTIYLTNLLKNEKKCFYLES